ncbi:uncharacterized protein LOC127809407 [Diospyros lotus]|uniref:uncharacterized protein LOC127809407 n=1 Tax=Diospyros lotus TaxID=55363 RepID=UPI00225618D6|nr:uncharacterized protein LOC127809407 [Diospyros lotus]
MGLGPEQLSSSPKPLYGFTGDAVTPVGRITLPFTIGDANRQTTTLAEFLIIDCPSAYNVVLGRPTMNDLDLVTSTRLLTVKFPTPNGVGCVRDRANHDLDPREVDYDKPTGLVEELKDISVNKAKGEKSLKLGKNLAPELKSQLTDFLKAKLDVFAWNHEDMVGIALEVMTHRFNVDPSYKPVHQKRRPMTPERYAALKEEVDKLLANKFIKEAYYPVWVANPVPVKKKNGKRRTCVNFTDLNKACPKCNTPPSQRACH